MFEFGVAAEVFGIDRTAEGLPAIDFRVRSTTPTVPLALTITTPLG